MTKYYIHRTYDLEERAKTPYPKSFKFRSRAAPAGVVRWTVEDVVHYLGDNYPILRDLCVGRNFTPSQIYYVFVFFKIRDPFVVSEIADIWYNGNPPLGRDQHPGWWPTLLDIDDPQVRKTEFVRKAGWSGRRAKKVYAFR